MAERGEFLLKWSFFRWHVDFHGCKLEVSKILSKDYAKHPAKDKKNRSPPKDWLVFCWFFWWVCGPNTSAKPGLMLSWYDAIEGHAIMLPVCYVHVWRRLWWWWRHWWWWWWWWRRRHQWCESCHFHPWSPWLLRLGEGPKAKNVLDTSDFDFEVPNGSGSWWLMAMVVNEISNGF